MSRDFNIYHPENYGWVSTKLHVDEIDYLWKLVNKTNRQEKYRMMSQTDGCFELFDEYDYFFENVLKTSVNAFEDNFGNNLRQVPVLGEKELCLSGLWVNYQKQNDFFPLHTHNGVYSFVVWMKIPTNFEDQIKGKPKANKVLFDGLYTSNFRFNYSNILGKNETFEFEMNTNMEGTMVLFPSNLQHSVYPFYNCDDERVSISGNLSLK